MCIALFLREIRLNDADNFGCYLRMDTKTYGFLLENIRDKITKQTTKFRKHITPEEQLSLTLTFMATGESFKSLSFQIRISDSICRMPYRYAVCRIDMPYRYAVCRINMPYRA